MIRFKRPASSVLWILFGLFTLILNGVVRNFPEFVEQWYSRGLFQLIRFGFDQTLGLLPFPAFYVFWVGVVIYWGWRIYRRPSLPGIWKKLGYWFLQVLGFAGLLIGLFYWLWAFNYGRVPVQTQLKLEVTALDTSRLWHALRTETRTLDSLRRLLVGMDTNAIQDNRFWPNNPEDTVRASVERWMASEGFPVGGRVRGRFIYPEGALFKFGASGIYWPFIGEGNLEAGMHPLRKLPAMAHEMSHGYGFADEGVCNFIAYAACADHSNRYMAYCARLDYWNTLAGACLDTDPPRYDTIFRKTIPRGMVADQQAIRRQHRKFKELAPQVRYQVYDHYLKAQGIQSGMLNYDEVLMLVEAWRKAQKH